MSNNRVTQVKTVETDGYTALQVVFGAQSIARDQARKAIWPKLAWKLVKSPANSRVAPRSRR